MRFRNEKKDTNIMINITSLIDVVFILLIFFAVTTSFVTPSSIKVDLPKAKGEAVEEKKNIRIAVDSKGALFLDGEAVKDDDTSNNNTNDNNNTKNISTTIKNNTNIETFSEENPTFFI